ncbi:hypothetical protein OM076_09045 [Solirubrobacter ginsenosidimutans]|uniref:Uncharacterized protein n=1 Tax=Solirubrobacter ginsenosidimutans TaxID=490573 RepID=A0A9X3RZ16_9ACTN|nr:hypothetical protein [Solirubrobacter ginsenosidimutans]MDA0160410.1 hypothetical protein [Solirubrobacter ginsenosidimutans]
MCSLVRYLPSTTDPLFRLFYRDDTPPDLRKLAKEIRGAVLITTIDEPQRPPPDSI